MGIGCMGGIGGTPSLSAQISAIFAGGQQGAWYDPSDFSTLFQDSAGVTAVTAVEQPVGLMLDKRLGLVLGPEIIVNGTFNTDSTGWTAGSGATHSVVAGRLRVTNTTTFGQAYQSFATVIGKRYQLKFDAYKGTATTIRVEVGFTVADTNNVGRASTVDVIGGTASFTATHVTSFFTFRADDGYGEIDNVSLKLLEGNHASQATAASRPILRQDAGGRYYLEFDGVDDGMATAAINFTATDKMTVFAGVLKAVSTQQLFAELSANTNTNAGSFLALSGTTFEAYARGNAAGSPSQIATIVSATPDTAVVAMTHDIAGDLSTIRRNAVAGTNGAGDKGLGNFGNYPLFIGSRAGTSLFFNGRIYSLIIRGAASSAAEIAAAERYVANTTGVTL